ncbi:MAG: ABC transporter ATP-binding protein [Rhodospirillaceae bacterium]|nr:ABC transporter ATP-binding protein [Rhodospirillaceae bacterium]
MTLLAVRRVGKFFGGVRALSDVSFDVAAGEIVGIMGANGAGKTTLFSVIAGHERPSAGEIVFDGRPLNGLRPHQVCRLGIARTFQIVRPFGGLTVEENVTTAALFGAGHADVAAATKRADDVLALVGLEERRHDLAETLTLSGQKRLELARAAATGGRLLMLDEVMAGLTPTEVAAMLDTVRRLHAEFGLTILVIEHVLRALMQLAQRIVVLHHGEMIAEGPPSAIGEDPRVLACYFGTAPS